MVEEYKNLMASFNEQHKAQEAVAGPSRYAASSAAQGTTTLPESASGKADKATQTLSAFATKSTQTSWKLV